MDTIETIHHCVVQHGPHNDRIYLMHLKTADPRRLIETLNAMAESHGYGKVFAKIPAPVWQVFQSAGYVKEAVVPGLFQGTTDGFFIAKYFAADRQKTEDVPISSQPGNADITKTVDRRPPSASASAELDACRLSDAAEMSAVYRRIFASYPFPIHDPSYLRRMITKGVRYCCIRINDQIAAVAAAEIDWDNKNAEMTDFATLPKWRGKGFAGRLLGHMDQLVRGLGIRTAYTIAKAASVGMNRVFQNHGYRYGGLLKNNSQISGRIRSMTVWYKHL